MDRSKNALLADIDALRLLATNLTRLESVTNNNSPEEDEAWTLAHDFGDLEQSFLTLLNELIPKLMNNRSSPDDLQNTLLDIGDEFRHIIYHIGNNRFFEYLHDDSVGEIESSKAEN